MQKQKLIGREKERAILENALRSAEPEMVAVVGRRRVGKTFLIKQTYARHLVFEVTGLQNAPLSEQLQNFAFRINRAFYNDAATLKPANWLEAFQMLIVALEKQRYRSKKVVFFDELPWFDSRNSGFLRALGFFWNSWCVDQHIVVVICGSAASWMIENVVNDKGGLHNRITKKIDLQSFTLRETELYLQSRKIRLERYQLLQLYMVLGGIPHYLKEVEPGQSAVENIGRICFDPNGALKKEFQNLYPALFDNAAKHIGVIRALAQKRSGMTRSEVITASRWTDNGHLTTVLQELIFSGFVTPYQPFGKAKKDLIYRLTDEYSLFYLQFMENSTLTQDADWWQSFSQTAAFTNWCGYAFENICFRHLAQIKKHLGIAGIYAEASSFYVPGNKHDKGIQIDLVLDRKDQTIHLFEFKFYNAALTLDKNDAQALRERRELFRQISKTKKHIFLSFVTTFGVKSNENSIGLVDHNLTLDALFAD